VLNFEFVTRAQLANVPSGLLQPDNVCCCCLLLMNFLALSFSGEDLF